MFRCNRDCSLSKSLFSGNELESARKQYPNYDVVTVEMIKHKGNRVKIDCRAIIFSPVGNQKDFWTTQGEQLRIPKVAIVGFSTSKEAMMDYYNNTRKSMDIDTAAKKAAFGGSKQLRKNLKRIADFLNLNECIGSDFKIDEMFESNQKDIFYTQIVKCCSIGKVNGVFSNSSAIYPNFVEPNLREKYLNHSGHRGCIENVFMHEMSFSESIPVILIFRPAWENLNEMNLLAKLKEKGKIIDWLPHPSNPGLDVNKLLKYYENGDDFTRDNWGKSAKQLIMIREKIKEIID